MLESNRHAELIFLKLELTPDHASLQQKVNFDCFVVDAVARWWFLALLSF
jgi:hypothetical protein